TTFVTALSPSIVHVDPMLVERAVSNLLDNAVKYSPAGAPIEVTVRDGEVLVADQGPGIAEEDLPRIFDRFYRSAAARSKPGAGGGGAREGGRGPGARVGSGGGWGTGRKGNRREHGWRGAVPVDAAGRGRLGRLGTSNAIRGMADATARLTSPSGRPPDSRFP